MPKYGRPIAERFWEKVPAKSPWPEDCWEWGAGLDRAGYGRFYTKEQSSEQAHQVAWRITGGTLNPGDEIDHACRNRACVRPGHLSVCDAGFSARQGGQRTKEMHRSRTHCRNGHEVNEKNLYVTSRGYWQCRPCHKDTEQRRRDRLSP